MLEEGYVHLYTGNGKGKTTAAMGLALRAAGAGLKTVIVQFMKGQHYSELESVKKLEGLIRIEQFGSKKFCKPGNEDFAEHYELFRKGYKFAREAINNDKYDIVILDEIVTSLLFDLVKTDEIIDLIKIKPKNKELILTGRNAPEELINTCDLVTEMKEIKHYYNSGVIARKGIEN